MQGAAAAEEPCSCPAGAEVPELEEPCCSPAADGRAAGAALPVGRAGGWPAMEHGEAKASLYDRRDDGEEDNGRDDGDGNDDGDGDEHGDERLCALVDRGTRSLGHPAKFLDTPRRRRPRWAQGPTRTPPNTGPVGCAVRTAASPASAAVSAAAARPTTGAKHSSGRKSPRQGGGVDRGRGRGPRHPSRTRLPTAIAGGDEDRRATPVLPSADELDDLQETESNLPAKLVVTPH